MAIKTKYQSRYGITTSTVQTGINFTSDAVTNAPVSKVYFNDKLVWAPDHVVTLSYSANTLSSIEYTLGFPGENGYQQLRMDASGTSRTLHCMEGQVLKITPVVKSNYALASHHDKLITVTGDMTIQIETYTVSKGKLSAPVLLSGFSGKVDSIYKAHGRFSNPNSISVTAKIRPFVIESNVLSQPTRDFWDRTDTLAANDYSILGIEGEPFDQYKGNTVIAVKFSAAGYEDSEWRVWSDNATFASSTAYTTGQIPPLVLNEGRTNSHGATLEGFAEFEDPDNDGDLRVVCSVWGRHPLDWPIVMTSPSGIRQLATSWRASNYRYAYVDLDDMPADNLTIKITCYDPKGIFKATTTQITDANLTELENS